MKEKIKYFSGVIAASLFMFVCLSGCKKELNEPNWDLDVLAPLAKATLSIENIVNDTLRITHPDNSVSLVYRSKLYKFTLDTLFKIPDTTISYTARLSNLDLGTIHIINRTSMGDIANEDLEENGPGSDLYTSIMSAHNSGAPTNISPVNEQVFDNVDIDAGNYFETVTLLDGYLDIKIDNQLPIALTNVIYQVKNVAGNSIVVEDTFLVIPAFSVATRTKSLAGLTVEGQMTGMVKISSPGGNGITIDTSMAMTAEITIRDLQIESATAIFPQQEIVNRNELTSFRIQDIQISKIIARTGIINIDVYNTIPETMHFNYIMHSATKNGTPLTINGTIPPSTGGAASHITLIKNIEGYNINLKGIGPVEQIQGDLDNNGIINPDTINTFYSTLKGSIDSSGNMVHINLQDSIYFNCTFTNLTPDYVEGFLGKDTISEQSEITYNLLPEIEGASINFNDVKVSLEVASQIGVNASLKINELKTINSNNNQTAILTIAPGINPFNITKPINPFNINTDVVPTTNTLQLNNTNSNINQLINILPNKIYYDVSIKTNPNTTPPLPGSGTDFVYYGDCISANLDVEIPLAVIASNINLCDTTKFNLGNENTDQIIGGNLIVFIDNDFPIEANPQVILLDENYNEIESIISAGTIVFAGDVNATTGRVALPKSTKIVISVTSARLQNLKKTKYIKSTAGFISRPQSQPVKIFNDYKMKFKVVGDFEYKLH